MHCKHCNNKLEPTQIWCNECGHQSELLKKDLSFITVLKESWSKYKGNINHNLAIGFILTFLAIIPIIIVSILHNTLEFSHKSFANYLIYNLLFIIITPLAFIPFKVFSDSSDGKASIKDFFSNFKFYPQMFLFAFANFLAFFIIKYVCIGDPILKLVRIVLVLYWPSIVLPVPFLISEYKMNPFKAIHLCYKKLGDVRWKLFFIWVFLLLLNMLGAIPFGIGLLVTLPFSYVLVNNYVRKLIEFNIIEVK